MKKIIALLMTVAMLLSVAAIGTTAAGTCGVAFGVPASIYEGDVFKVELQITDLATFGGCDLYVTYDATKIDICQADGSAAPTLADAVESSITEDGAKYQLINSTYSAGSIYYGPSLSFSNSNPSEAITSPFTVVTIWFKALESGATALTFTPATVVMENLDDVAEETAATQTIAVQEMPEKPEITAASIGGTLKAGAKAEATYTWDNGNISDDPEVTGDPLTDASVINWTVDGTAVEKLATDGRTELTLKDEWVGKKLAYTVRPTAARGTEEKPLNNTADADVVVVASDATMVKAADDYLATFKAGTDVETTGITDAKITLTKEATATVVFDDTYPAAAYVDNSSTYAWYLLGEDVTDATAAAAATVSGDPVSATDSVTFEDTEVLNRWVKLVVTPKALVAGEAFEDDAVEIVAEIFGQPPTLAEDAAAEIEKLEAKKYSTSSTPNVTAVEFDSNVAEGTPDVDLDYVGYSYKWYLTSTLTNAETFAAAEKTEITAEAALGTPGKVKLSKVDGAAGKYLVAVITAADDLGISSDVTLFFQNAIKEGSSGGSAVQGGASLVTGTAGPTGGEETTTPGTTNEDDDIISDTNPEGNPTDGEERGAAQFTDVDKETYAWAYDYIDALTKAGVIKGMTETTFAPEGTTTVAQAVALAVRVTGLTAEDAATEKVDEAHWSYAEMAIADANGVLAIFGDAVDADAAITREQIAAVVYAAAVAAEVELPADAEAIEFSDASAIAEGAAEAVDALVKAGVINGMGDGTFAPKANTTRAQMAKIIGIVAEIIG